MKAFPILRSEMGAEPMERQRVGEARRRLRAVFTDPRRR